LRKDSLFPLEKHRFPALADGREEFMGIEIAPFLGRYTWTYGVSLWLECWVAWGLAGDFSVENRSVGEQET